MSSCQALTNKALSLVCVRAHMCVCVCVFDLYFSTSASSSYPAIKPGGDPLTSADDTCNNQRTQLCS